MTKEIRALDRGLDVLETLAASGAMSLADLARETGLAKSTLRRLLGTLARRRFVRRSLADGRYRVAVTLPDISEEPVPRGMALLADTALPHALDLTRAIGWPSDIHVRDGVAMRIVESTRPASPHLIYRGQVNRRVSHFASAAGITCLAALDWPEVEALHRATEDDPLWGLARFGISLEDYRHEVEQARGRGYGARLAVYLGETPLDDELHAIAVPLRLEGRPAGALSLLWPRSLRPVDDFAAEHAGALRQTCEAIDADLASIAAR